MSSIDNIIKRIRENRILNERKDYSDKSRDELITMAQDGDQLAFETLLKSHKDFISKMSRKYVLDTGDRDDVEQVASIAFWDAVTSWDHTGNFEAYAGMIIKRKLTDELRKDSAGKVQINTLANSIEDTIASNSEGDEQTIGDTLASSEASPEEQILGKEGARELIKFMRDNLSASERDVVMMYIKNYKISEIAEELNMKYKSAENALMRVKNKLADYLRTRESKKIRESKTIEFSDEEKLVLESVLTKIKKDENTSMKLRESYDNYTTSQIDDELSEISDGLDDLAKNFKYYDRDQVQEEADGYYYRAYAIFQLGGEESEVTDEQAEMAYKLFRRAEDILSEYDSKYATANYN